MTDQLIPRAPRRMKQPTKDALRKQLAQTDEDNARLRAENESLKRPWWRRLLRRAA